MEALLSNNIERSKSISILGDNHQVFQIILRKNESIIVNSFYICYSSSPLLEEISYDEVNSLVNFNSSNLDRNEKKVSDKNIIRLRNKSNSIEYIGLTKGGKLMKISPLLYNNLFIRLDALIAFSDNLLLIEDSEYNKKIDNHFKTIMDIASIKTGKKFVMIKNQNKQNSFKPYGTNFISETDVNSYLNDFLYLSGEKMLIEKRLGDNEQIVIMKEGLVAFEKSVTFYKVNGNKNKYVNSNEDIIIGGPGLIIFEPFNRKIQIIHKNRFLFMIITLIVITLLETVVQFYII